MCWAARRACRTRSALPALAHAVYASPTVRRHPRPFRDEAEAEDWLAAMWLARWLAR